MLYVTDKDARPCVMPRMQEEAAEKIDAGCRQRQQARRDRLGDRSDQTRVSRRCGVSL